MEPSPGVDESPLHSHMDKNKESLKVKLMLRRPINQLVAQGIMPPLKTPPAFHEQRQKLERAKMGDLLKAKIQQRPDREELVRQHILEDVGHVDPSLAEKQRKLKKCRLADALNDQLSHRPGPLELIKKNILHTEEPIERAIKEGALEFKATCEGTATKPTHPDHYMLDEDSGNSLSPPPTTGSAQPPSPPTPAPITPTTTTQRVILTPVSDESLVTSSTPTSSPSPVVTVLLTPSTAIAIPAQATLQYRTTIPQLPQQTQLSSSSSSLKDKSRKKSKAKVQPKARTIKFHEYKGPPSAHKNAAHNASSVETSYDLLLQQQQLFLQWQLEWQHKYPQILLPASKKPTSPPPSVNSASSNSIDMSPSSSSSAPPPPPPPLPKNSPPPPLRNLEDMKVSDLKAELKKRNLPVSGAKPQLIERLKPFSESAINAAAHAQQEDSLPSVCSVTSSSQIVSSVSAMDTTESPVSPQSPQSTVTTTNQSSSPKSQEEEIIRDQQRKIDLLQRELNQQIQNNTFQQQPNAKASLAAFLQQQQLNHQLLQQQIIANNNNNNIIIKQEESDIKANNRITSLPSFTTFMNNTISDLVNEDPYSSQNKSIFNIQSDHSQQDMSDQVDVKSQIVDDVLEILIKNGELPASAAAEPLELSALQGIEGMDVDQELMDVDADWLDSLISGNGSGNSYTYTSNNGDPLLGAPHPPSPPPSFDLFIDDTEFKLPTSPNPEWDRIDFAI